MFKNFRLTTFIIFVAAIFTLPIISFAQNPVSWLLESDAKGKTLQTGEKFQAKLKAKIEGEWHLYAVEQPEGGPYPTKITVAENLPFELDGKIISPAPITKFDPNFEIDTKFFAEKAEFTLPIKATSETNGDNLAVNVRFQVCDDKVCLPPKTVKVSFAGFEDVKKSGQSSVVSGQPSETKESQTTSNEQLTTDY